nr:MAG TPA_asm: hypothetical protein [Caudoviricetes sp.]
MSLLNGLHVWSNKCQYLKILAQRGHTTGSLKPSISSSQKKPKHHTPQYLILMEHHL